ncbi:MAG: mannonate dehydratase [Candidatus Handelsmanbacteria bacterium]|nr:mannonate dehydratase [Candidatus Handelsmanbacteria bacterium]
MLKISVWHGDLSDRYLKKVTQLGVDCLDFGNGGYFPGVKEQGYPDLDALLKIKKKLASYGLEINRVTLPDLTEKFVQGRKGGDKELVHSCKALRIFGAAGLPIARQRFAGDTFPQQMRAYRSTHRGGYRSRGEALARPAAKIPTPEELEKWWERFSVAYSQLVPVAEECGVKLAIHPSDTPNVETPLGGLGYHRVIDAFPSRSVGYLYCCGTRAEAGGSSLVLDELHNYGRKGRILMVHLRNVRASLATAGAFEEVLLDDGDLNPFKVLLELKRVGFSGCINPDHIPAIEGDGPLVEQGMAYSVGYLKALLAALATL